MLKHDIDQRMIDFGKDGFGCRILTSFGFFATWYAKLIKQNLAKLFWAC